jgi:anti-sigma B factor antagonist
MADLEETNPRADVHIETSSDASGTPTVTVRGDLDMSNADALKATVTSLAARKPDALVVDLSGLRFMDSAGIAVLVDAANQVPNVRLRHPSAAVRRVVEMTGLNAIVAIEP